MMQLHRGTRPLAGMLAAGCVGVVLVLTLVSDGPARTVLDPHDANNPIPVNVGNWRTDNNVLWCGDDPDCDYGNVAKNKEEAYANPSPLAIINDDYKEGQLNPFPGPRNFGPDSPMSWLGEDDELGLGVAAVWPDYTGSPNSRVNAEKSGVQLLRLMPAQYHAQMRLQAPRLELVQE